MHSYRELLQFYGCTVLGVIENPEYGLYAWWIKLITPNGKKGWMFGHYCLAPMYDPYLKKILKTTPVYHFHDEVNLVRYNYPETFDKEGQCDWCKIYLNNTRKLYKYYIDNNFVSSDEAVNLLKKRVGIDKGAQFILLKLVQQWKD